MNVTADQALPGDTRRLLLSGSDATLPQNNFGIADIAFGLNQGALAFHHAGAGAVTELLYELRGNFRHSSNPVLGASEGEVSGCKVLANPDTQDLAV